MGQIYLDIKKDMKTFILTVYGCIMAVIVFFLILVAFRFVKIDYTKERLTFIWNHDIVEVKDGK